LLYPETGWDLDTASISARVPAHTVAIEDEPFDSRNIGNYSIAYGFFSSGGIMFFKAL